MAGEADGEAVAEPLAGEGEGLGEGEAEVPPIGTGLLELNG